MLKFSHIYFQERERKKRNLINPQGEANESAESKIAEVPGAGKVWEPTFSIFAKFWRYQSNFTISIPNEGICKW